MSIAAQVELAFNPAEPRDPHSGKWYHGTSDVLGPGDVIDPSVSHRANFDPEHSDPKSVYIAGSFRHAMHYAERDRGGLGEPHVYEVESLGEHWPIAPGSGQHQTKSPIRIVREVTSQATELAFSPDEPRDKRGRWYHGSEHQYSPGDLIDPAHFTAYYSDEVGEPTSEQKVHRIMFTADRNTAATYGEHVYEVEPTGSFHPHPYENGTQVTGSPLRILREPIEQSSIAAQVLDMTGDGHGHHIPGTPFVYRHGWQPLTGGPHPEVHGYEGHFESTADTFIPDLTAAHGVKALESRGRPDGTGTAEDPIDVQGNLDHAIVLMAQGKHVRLNQVDEIATLTDRVNDLADKLKARTGSEPKWDFGLISVRGTNLFTQQTRGIPRVQMPQTNGPAEPGTEAARIAGGAGKFVDLAPQFRQALIDSGVKVTETRVKASHLRATQLELTAATVAGISEAARGGNRKVLHMLQEPIWVSRDNYVIDGHHRWAAEMVADARDGVLGNDTEMNVHRVDMDIGAVIPFANDFTRRMGIGGRALGNTKLVEGSITGQAMELAFNPAERRDQHGQWISYEAGRMKTDLLPAGRPNNRRGQLEDLLDSVREHGVREPIALRHNSEGVIIANGRHRAELARRAGIEDVPVVVQHSEGVNPRALPLRGRRAASEHEFTRAYAPHELAEPSGISRQIFGIDHPAANLPFSGIAHQVGGR